MMDVMLDLETLGTSPGSIILSIGAVEFDPTTGLLGKEFYRVINSGSSEILGLTADASTLKWWEGQTKEARTVLTEAKEAGTVLQSVLIDFNEFLSACGFLGGIRVWGNGSDFDNVLLIAAYKAAGLKPAWKYSNSRCFRTLKNLIPSVADNRVVVEHNALADARAQAEHAMALLITLNASLTHGQRSSQ